jgi:hypothetical protein
VGQEFLFVYRSITVDVDFRKALEILEPLA